MTDPKQQSTREPEPAPEPPEMPPVDHRGGDQRAWDEEEAANAADA